MNTFPLRITRSQLAPQMRDNRPVENPETDLGADTVNALFDQVAGLNVIVPRVSLIAKRTGTSTFTIYHQAEAWNPDGSQPHPTLVDDPDAVAGAPGRYIYTFASSYLNGQGLPITTSLPGPRITTFGAPASDAAPYASRVTAQAWFKVGNPLIVKIAISDASGTLTDAPFWLEVM